MVTTRSQHKRIMKQTKKTSTISDPIPQEFDPRSHSTPSQQPQHPLGLYAVEDVTNNPIELNKEKILKYKQDHQTLENVAPNFLAQTLTQGLIPSMNQPKPSPCVK